MKARREPAEPVVTEDVKNVMVMSFMVNKSLGTRSEKSRPRFEYAAGTPIGFKFPINLVRYCATESTTAVTAYSVQGPVIVRGTWNFGIEYETSL
jgi:hypothetical protein